MVCQCRDLNNFLQECRLASKGQLKEVPTVRCGPCVDSILTEKNRLVQENETLRQHNEILRLHVGLHVELD